MFKKTICKKYVERKNMRQKMFCTLSIRNCCSSVTPEQKQMRNRTANVNGKYAVDATVRIFLSLMDKLILLRTSMNCYDFRRSFNGLRLFSKIGNGKNVSSEALAVFAYV
jgi:hypothetical protein